MGRQLQSAQITRIFDSEGNPLIIDALFDHFFPRAIFPGPSGDLYVRDNDHKKRLADFLWELSYSDGRGVPPGQMAVLKDATRTGDYTTSNLKLVKKSKVA